MRKVVLAILPVLFTAQACNFLFGDLYGEQQSGARGIFASVDSGDTWEEANKVSPDKSLAGAPIAQIYIEEEKSDNILAATLTGGVYASDNAAESWVPLLPGFAASDAYINPSNHDEIYAAGAKSGIAVIMKSADRGGTWTQIYNAPSKGLTVSVLRPDPKNPAMIYAGLSSGTLLRSIDSGVTWNSLAELDGNFRTLVITGNSKGTMYALLREQGFRRSDNSGKTWTKVELPDSPSLYNDLYVDPANGTTLMAATDKGLYRSFNSGNTWSPLQLPVNPDGNNVTAVAVNPEQKSQIFTAVRYTIYRSNDSGQTWKTVSLPTGRTVWVLAVDPEEPNRVYAGLR